FAGNSFTAGNSVLNTTGFHITGGPSVTATGIDAGNKAITNVASGGTTRSNAATVGDVQDAVANLSQNLNITDGTNNGTVDLKTQKLNVAGANGVTATVNNQTITVGLDTATKTAIDNAQTAVNRTISLGADSGTISSQSLKDGNVAFNVKGKTGDYITTAMNGNTVEISTQQATLSNNATTGDATVTGNDGLVTAKNVADTINAVADKIKTSSAWKLTTNSSATDVTDVKSGDTVDLVNGDNIEISQDGTNKKKVTIKTKKDLTVDSIVANKSVTVGSGTNQISLDGTTGAVSGNIFAGNSFTAGNSVLNTTGFHITGGPSVTATGIDAGNKAITNVASGGTTRSNAATVGDVQDAVANLSQNLNITDGTNNGTVDLKTQKLNVAGANGVTATVNNQTITVGLDTNVVNATTKGIGLTGDTGTTGNKYLKDGDVSFAIMGDGKLVTTSATATGVKVAVNTATITAGADGTITGPTTDGVATAKNVADAINAAKKAGKTEITANTGEAANATTGNISLTSTTATDGHTIYDVKLNDKVTLGSGANAVTIDGTAGKATIGSSVIDGVNNTFTTGGNKAVTLNGATGTITGTTANIGGVTVNGTANTVNGLSNTTWNGTAVSGRAATEDQLQQVSDAVNAGWKVNTGAVTGSSGISTGATSTKVSSGEEVKLQAGDNLVIDQNGKTVSYSLNKDLIKMNSATFEATGGKTTVIKGDSIVQNDGAGNTNTSNATSNTLKNTSGDETKVDAKGATVKNAAGDTTKVNATGTTVADSTGNNKSEYTKDGVTITKLGKDTVSLTHDGLNNGNNKIVNVAAGTANMDAVNVSQLKDTVANSGWKVTVGTDESGQSNVTGTSPEKIKADEIVTFKAGNNMIVTQTGKTISYAVNPVLSGMTSATFTDPAGNTTITNGNGITIAPAGGAPSVYLTKDGLNNGGNKITNVAPGQAPTDAVNMSQLQGIGNSQVAAINQVAAEVERVGAHAAAMAALKPIQYDPLEPTQFMAGVGNYRGQTAAAIGLAHYTNDNTMFNVGVSVGGNHNMVNAGVTHKFGISAEKKNIPDRYKAGPISSIYVMQDEMTQLRSENEAYKAKLDKQQSEIDALKAAVDQLLASKA
ncbi:MAG: YadA-like family protein, partial [Veillonella sp.]|nr:YadA-like family protein [Veillonella sp.]